MKTTILGALIGGTIFAIILMIGWLVAILQHTIGDTNTLIVTFAFAFIAIGAVLGYEAKNDL